MSKVDLDFQILLKDALRTPKRGSSEVHDHRGNQKTIKEGPTEDRACIEAAKDNPERLRSQQEIPFGVNINCLFGVRPLAAALAEAVPRHRTPSEACFRARLGLSYATYPQPLSIYFHL